MRSFAFSRVLAVASSTAGGSDTDLKFWFMGFDKEGARDGNHED